MADHSDIRQRLAALAELERAKELLAAGRPDDASQALQRCLIVLPDLPEAQALQFELSPAPAGESAPTTARRQPGSRYFRTQTCEIDASPEGLHEHLLRAARHGDHERVVQLGEPLLAGGFADSDTGLQALIAASAKALSDSQLEENLDLALTWANAWWRHSRDPQARERMRRVSERLDRAREQERLLREALTGAAPLAELRRLLAEFESDGMKIEGGHTLLDRAREQIALRARDLALLQQRLSEVVPARLDEAQGLMEQICAEQPSPEHMAKLRDLRSRRATVAALHEQVSRVCGQQRIDLIDAAVAALRLSQDRLSNSDQVLAQAQSLRAELGRQREHCVDRFRRQLELDLTASLEALAQLAHIDPGHECLARRADLEREHARVAQLHHRAREALTATPGEVEVLERTLLDLDSLPHPLRDSPDIRRRVARRAEHLRQRERSQYRRLRLGLVLAVIVILMPSGKWFFDRVNVAAMHAIADEDERIRGLESFAQEGWLRFHRSEAQAAATRLRTAVIERHWQAIQIMELDDRPAALEAFIAKHYQDPWQRRAREKLRHVRSQLRERTLAGMLAIHEPQRRLAAIDDWLGRVDETDPDRDRVLRRRQEALRQIDDQNWQPFLSAANEAEREQAALAYLQVLPEGTQADKARLFLATIGQQRQQAAERQADAEAWQAVLDATDPALRLERARDYLSTAPDEGRRRARLMIDALERELDDAAFATAVGVQDPQERLRALSDYLDRRPRRHELAAQRLMAEIVAVHDRQLWDKARAAGPSQERVERLRAYLGIEPPPAFAEEARSLLGGLLDQIDRQDYVEARSLLNPIQRVRALQNYLTGSSIRSRRIEAEADLLAALQQLAQASPTMIASYPPDIRGQMPNSVLMKLPRETLVDLPDDALRRLPRELLALLPTERRVTLPADLRLALMERPAWASNFGHDSYGPWADLRLTRGQALRMRPLPTGSIALDHADTDAGSEAAIVTAQDLWLSETCIDQAQWRSVLGEQRVVDTPANDRLAAQDLDPANIDSFLAAINRNLTRKQVQVRPLRPAEWRFALLSGAGGGAQVENFPQAGPVPALAKDTDLKPVDAPRPDAWGLRGLDGMVAHWCQDENGHWWILGRAYNESQLDPLQARPITATTTAGLRIALCNR